MDDKDANCRLRHGLNVQCLVHIFQYLNSSDLFTVGEMNEFYRQLINDLVIPLHEIDFTNLFDRYITISEVIQRYGIKIRNINFKHMNFTHSVGRLIRSIDQYCGADQLRSVKIYCRILDVEQVNLPIQFRNVKRLEICGNRRGHRFVLSVQLSKSLRYLRLESLELNENFDWTKLTNLTKLYLRDVRGINAQNFIELLRQRPNIQIFHHDKYSFNGSILDISEAMAEYCGNQIEEYNGEMPKRLESGRAPTRYLYPFISQFKNVKRICLATNLVCGADLIEPMKQLAKLNTVDMLHIKYPELDCIEHSHADCIFKENSNIDCFDMMHFNHLKTLTVSKYYCEPDAFNPMEKCKTLALFSVYKQQILSNVERLTLGSQVYDFDFIKFASKLRFVTSHGSEKDEIVSVLKTVLQNRNNGRASDDFIEFKMIGRKTLKLFAEAAETAKTAEAAEAIEAVEAAEAS